MNPASAPTHHLHISTEFMVCAGILVLIALGILAWIVVELRGPKRDAGKGFAPPAPPRRPDQRSTFMPPPVRHGPTPSTPRASEYRSAPVSYTEAYRPRVPYVPDAPVVASAAPPPSGIGAGTGFVGGLAVGALLDGALRDEPAYVPPPAYDPSPSYDAASTSSSSDSGGFTYDSGPSVSDSSSSGDSGSSGGFDVSW